MAMLDKKNHRLQMMTIGEERIGVRRKRRGFFLFIKKKNKKKKEEKRVVE